MFLVLETARSLRSPEPLVSEMLSKSKNFKATTSTQEGVDFSSTIMIVVATPSVLLPSPFLSLSLSLSLSISLLVSIYPFTLSNPELFSFSCLHPP